ncbi:2-isopropylmalate synthase [Halobacillus litoralis]|uniref:2-isopropylmalate synthase n=1 Tax=Halobacillus litoralis TaxID=45668 RepID=A0A845DQ78_9BACI|nr:MULTISPECIES: 2-isopropylmalate synthase [Halobacillus]MCA1022419.1 2-isopropylmalate synthase [Halobacillus litoralis]MYL18532.1 2-isopropylmalate synthase [Halobacillus litoralis]MYL30459.1 2-isopropylmalate synthase [Halobacillus halophilus]MYL38827.1 2-isopropylmalate synthase [Halobacillus litoralis]
MAHVNVFDTTLRDGEQSAGVNLNRLEKVEIAKQLERLGVDIMEAGFPASSQADFDAVKEIADTVRGCSVTGLARANKRDIDIAWEALKGGAEPRLHVFLATSPIHMTHKLKKTPDEVVETAVNMVRYAREKFPYVQFSAEDALRSDRDFLVHIIEQVIDAGASVINLPDTVGFTTPDEIGSLFRYVREKVPNIDQAVLSTHNHDDLGMAVSNSLAAVENGAGQIEGTINGIGERAGNAALEEIAVALQIRQDRYDFHTGLVLKEIKRTSDLVSRLTGMQVPGNKAVVGRNAFAHESGIHQDGVLKEATTYEIITPAMVGIDSNRMVLGKHSGRHAFKQKAEELGFELNESKLKEAFESFKNLTGKKKEVTDDDLFAILTDTQTEHEDQPKYELKAFQVQYGSINRPTATVLLTKPDGEEAEKANTGEGSVEAIYNTLDDLIDADVHLQDYQLSSIGRGRDALAEVHVQLTVDGVKASGRGSAQDVLEASAHAFLNAVNRTLYQHKRHEGYQKVQV